MLPFHRVAGPVWVAALIASSGAISEPALAQTAKWVQLPPVSLPNKPSVYDSHRHRTLIFDDRAIWAVSNDSIPVFSQLLVGDFPWLPSMSGLGFEYDPLRDQLLVFSPTTFATGTGGGTIPGRLWTADLAQVPLQWTEHFPGLAPDVVGYTTMYDPLRDRFLLFGGLQRCCSSNKVFQLLLTGGPAWSEVATIGTPPTGRSGANSVYDPWRDRMLVFGGAGTDETWELSLDGFWEWKFLPPVSSVAFGRSDANAVLDQNSRQWIITGGRGAPNFQLYADSWALDLSASAPADNATWARITGAPPARDGAIAWYDDERGRVVRHGGSMFGEPRVDEWTLSSGATAWSSLVSDSLDLPRTYGGVVFPDPANHRLYQALGSDGTTWVRDLENDAGWDRVADSGPGVRWFATGATDSEGAQGIVFGGVDPQTNLDSAELWTFDFQGAGWTHRFPSASPSPRSYALGVFDPTRRRFVIHGGCKYVTLGGRADTWLYDVVAGTWSSPSVGGFGDRYGEAGIYDPVRDRLIAFGGTDSLGHDYNDVHVLPLGPGGTWSTLATSGAPPTTTPSTLPEFPRGTLDGVYDPTGDRMILLLGNGSTMEVWQLTLGANPTWSQLAVEGGSPKHRYHAAVDFEASPQRVLMVGGCLHRDYSPQDETWALYLDSTTPTAIALVSADATPERVRIVWQAPHPSFTATLQRRVSGEAWAERSEVASDGSGFVTFVDREVVPGTSYDYRLRVLEQGMERFIGATTIRVPARSTLSLDGARPNPSRGDLYVSFALGTSEPATLDLFDIAGRRVLRREVGSLGPGSHVARLVESRSSMSSGRYVLRLTQGREVRSLPVILTR